MPSPRGTARHQSWWPSCTSPPEPAPPGTVSSVGQSLYVTEGEGRIQTRGENIVNLRTGDTVFAPGGEWHWHGASPDHLMTHLAVSEGQPEWGDHVTDEEYGGED